ncbi:hypothetical protein [Rhodococcus sp. PvP104]|uniref:hypothetical protein n=1 Tax=Rhodococcus sp. PvP104 TaxID=2817911 RepID=UPI001AE8DE2B|nr:hypothetical protein [Rhodococcus sp. PvP104]MBP2527195.1 heme/copper-type cytochrome/quinol oxidase subunit 1 [Rhodococcus sp. PvP104]
MVQVWTFAVFMVVLVGAAVLPRRAGQPRQGFPWFWLSFPMAALLVAGSLHMWLPGISAASSWTMYMPLADRGSGLQFLSNEQLWQVQAFLLGRWILPIAALVLAGLSVWSWRRGRI